MSGVSELNILCKNDALASFFYRQLSIVSSVKRRSIVIKGVSYLNWPVLNLQIKEACTMYKTRTWNKTTIDYHFGQTDDNQEVKQRFNHAIENPTDKQILQVGAALNQLRGHSRFLNAEITVNSTIFADN